MSLLLISLLALAIAPYLFRLADRAPATLTALDGFVMIAVAGLVLVHTIPHGIAAGGPWAVALALFGFLAPGFIENNLRRAAKQTHTVTLILALVGLGVHAFFDGVALAAPEVGHEEGESVLAIAVALHRLPIAITLWWLLRPSAGRVVAAATLAGLGVATLTGFALGDAMSQALEAQWLGLLQSLVAGSLLHVVIHRPGPLSAPTLDKRGRLWAGIGALAGIALVTAFSDTHLPLHEPGTMNFADAFITLVLETAPALVVAFALAGMVQVFLPHASMRWMSTGKPLSESVRGMVFGLPLPICSCGVIPLYRTLVMQGVPATAAMAFLVATPELGLDAILISMPLLGKELTLARVICAAGVAIFVGWAIGRLAPTRPSDAVEPPVMQSKNSWLGRLRAGLNYGFGEIVDHIGPWLLLGLAIASVAEPMLSGSWFAALPFGIDVVLFAAIGTPTYVCASGATPLAAVLIHKGVSPGAALAFLLAGPATNVTTFGVLRDLHGPRIALAFGGVIVGLSVALGVGLNLIVDDIRGVSLYEAVHKDPSALAIASVAVLAIVFATSIMRQGPRSFIGQVIAPYADEDEAHGQDHCHDHCH